MGTRGNGFGREVSSTYTPEQIESILNECGVEIVSELTNEFLCFCPFHGNKYTPSFAVSGLNGLFYCFNASCAETGVITDLIKFTTGRNDYEALRLVARAKTERIQSMHSEVEKILISSKLPEFSQDTLDTLYGEFWICPEAQEYMYGRGFEEETLDNFRIGYSKLRKMITVPMHSVDGKPIGIIGRKANSIDKTFKNSKGLPTSRSLWNIHRAKRAANTVIICEASFDAMLIHQAGFPNVVACLGGNFSDYHREQLDRYFNKIIIMTDFDDVNKHTYKDCKRCAKKGFNKCQGHNPGRALGNTIAETMKGKTIRWASADYGIVYPEGIKDAGDMSAEMIKHCINNSVSNFEYQSWQIPG